MDAITTRSTCFNLLASTLNLLLLNLLVFPEIIVPKLTFSPKITTRNLLVSRPSQARTGHVLLFVTRSKLRILILTSGCLRRRPRFCNLKCLFSFQDTIVTTLAPCFPKHVMWQPVILGASEFKVRNSI